MPDMQGHCPVEMSRDIRECFQNIWRWPLTLSGWAKIHSLSRMTAITCTMYIISQFLAATGKVRKGKVRKGEER